MGLAPITIEGRLGGDPELKFLPDGAAVVNFNIAHTERRKNAQTGQWEDGQTIWFPITAWRNLAENIAESLRTGDLVVVHGDLSEDVWTDRNTNQERRRMKVTARYVGASLSSKTVTINRVDRQQQQQQPAQDPWASQQGRPVQGQQQQPAQDPWAGQPQQYGQPPF